MSAAAAGVAAKVPPKTLHQFRNVAYIVVAWFGFNKGFREKSANDALWVEHQQKLRQQNAERYQAAQALRAAQESATAVQTIPAIVPEDLHEVYKEVKKSIQ